MICYIISEGEQGEGQMLRCYLEMWKKTFHYGGRTKRREYWLAILCNFLVFLGLMGMGIYFLNGIFILGIFYYQISIIPQISLQIRRLHDIGKSGYLVLVGLIPPGILYLMLISTTESQPYKNKYDYDPD